jgi:DNA-binding MarR family transcriptional regulator
MRQGDAELRFGYLIHDVSRLRRTLFDRWLLPRGITRSQWWVLAFLSRDDGMPQTALAAELDVGKVALGALIDRLELGGFVERQPDPADRRVKRVILTERGKALVADLRSRNREFNRLVMRSIPDADIAVTIRALGEIKSNLQANADQGAAPLATGTD